MVTHHSDVAEPVNGSRLTYAELWVDGMTCASCAARVQRALTKLAGVSTAGVNFATGKASVDYDAAITSPEAIEAAVTRSGYGPRPVVDVKSATISEASEAERLQGDSREQRAWLVRTGVALRSGAVPRRGDPDQAGGPAGHDPASGVVPDAGRDRCGAARQQPCAWARGRRDV